MVRLSVTLPDEQYNEIKAYCEEKEMKLSGLFRLGAKKVMENES